MDEDIKTDEQPTKILFRIEDDTGGPPGPKNETTSRYVIEVIRGELEIPLEDKYHNHYWKPAYSAAKRLATEAGLEFEIECSACQGRKTDSYAPDGICKHCNGSGINDWGMERHRKNDNRNDQ